MKNARAKPHTLEESRSVYQAMQEVFVDQGFRQVVNRYLNRVGARISHTGMGVLIIQNLKDQERRFVISVDGPFDDCGKNIYRKED